MCMGISPLGLALTIPLNEANVLVLRGESDQTVDLLRQML